MANGEAQFGIAVFPPQTTIFWREGEQTSGAAIVPSVRFPEVLGPIDVDLRLPFQFYGDASGLTGASVQAAVVVRYSRDMPENFVRVLPGFGAGPQLGTSLGHGPDLEGGAIGCVDYVRVGPLTLGGCAFANYPRSYAVMPFQLELRERPPSPHLPEGSFDESASAPTGSAVGRAGTSSPVTVRNEEPLSAGFDLGEFKGTVHLVAALADLLQVSTEELQAHLEKTSVLKPTDKIIAGSPLVPLVQGGTESVIGILRGMTPDRDHVLDPADRDIFYGMAQHLAEGFFSRMGELKKGAVFNDLQDVTKPNGKDFEVLPRVFTSACFPKSRYPNLTPEWASNLLSRVWEYDQWAPSYRGTFGSSNNFGYVYLEDAFDAHGINYNYPIKAFGPVYTNTWTSGEPLLGKAAYRAHLEDRLRALRQKTGANLKPIRLAAVYGGWLHIPLANGDVYSVLYTCVKPDQRDWILALSKPAVEEKTNHSYVKFVHGIGERSNNPTWRRPSLGGDWKMPFFHLVKGRQLSPKPTK